MASPRFKINDLIYLRASANIGYLESYRISQIQQITDGKWVYRVAYTPQPPAALTIGDRADIGASATEVFYDEAELLTFCDAVQLQIEALQRRLLAAQNSRIGKCPGL